MNPRFQTAPGNGPGVPDGPAWARAPRVLVVDADRAMFDLLREWLAALDCEVVEAPPGAEAGAGGFDLVVVDVAFPRQGGPDLLRRIAGHNPGTPILALSSNFLPGIERSASAARSLGVARVLPMPVAGDALLLAVRQLLRLEA